MFKLDELRNTTNAIDKSYILLKLTELEKKVFLFANDPYLVFHINKVDIEVTEEGEPSHRMFDLLMRLHNRELTGNQAKAMVESFIAGHGNLILKICQNKLNCGVSAITFNKVFKNYIPTFKLQLAKVVPFEDITFPILAQVKFDGVRIITIKRKGIATFYTRNGKVVDLPHHRMEVEASKHDNFVLDGEMTIINGRMEDRTTVSGMINSAIHGGVIDEFKLVYDIFDAMELDDWDRQRCLITYSGRLDFVRELTNTLPRNFQLVTSLIVKDLKQLQDHYAMTIALGLEGLILKYRNHKYTFKRSKDWIKLKETKTADLTCVGFNLGEGKREGGIGSLLLEGIVEGKHVKVSVGSGLNDQDVFKPFDLYSNKTIEVKYNTVIQDKFTKQWSLFLPRFICVRFDK